MTFTINENVCKNAGLEVSELLVLIFIKQDINIEDILKRLLDKNIIVKEGLFNKYLITQRWDDVVSEILLDSDKNKPNEDNLTSLAIKLMSIFDKGKKDNKYYFKGNKREIILKLKKFFKIYGTKYTNEDILKATTRYVNSFNGNYTYMRLLKYFICKDERKTNSEGMNYIEEVSELATYLDNLDSNDSGDDWTSTLK